MRSLILVLGVALVFSNTANCQNDSTTRPVDDPHPGRAWIIPIGVVASTTIDAEMREWALRTHSRGLDHLAHAINPLGTAHVLIPAMAIFYAGSLITHQTSGKQAAIEMAAAYGASDVVESILKPAIGRERPHVGGNSHRFHGFTSNGDWHSLPSAHVAHITAIAEALSLKADSRPLTLICDGLVALVGWDRVYEDQHWTSDVTATAALSAAISRLTVRWLESRWNQR